MMEMAVPSIEDLMRGANLPLQYVESRFHPLTFRSCQRQVKRRTAAAIASSQGHPTRATV